jgi:hypothetical protein
MPPMADGESYNTANMGVDVEVVLQPTAGFPRTLVWLPGSGQCPDNAIFRRLVNALDECQRGDPATRGDASEPALGVAVQRVVGTSLDRAEATIQRLLRDAAAARHRELPVGCICVGGHSRGAGRVAVLANAHGLSRVLFGVAPPPSPPRHTDDAAPPPRCLTVVGENDGGRPWMAPRASPAQRLSVKHVSERATVVVPYDGDHSLRVRAASARGDKAAYTHTPDTRAMTLEVAAFVQRAVWHADGGETPQSVWTSVAALLPPRCLTATVAVTTEIGQASAGLTDADGLAPQFSDPVHMVMLGTDICLADQGSYAVRRVADVGNLKTVTTYTAPALADKACGVAADRFGVVFVTSATSATCSRTAPQRSSCSRGQPAPCYAAWTPTTAATSTSPHRRASPSWSSESTSFVRRENYRREGCAVVAGLRGTKAMAV